ALFGPERFHSSGPPTGAKRRAAVLPELHTDWRCASIRTSAPSPRAPSASVRGHNLPAEPDGPLRRRRCGPAAARMQNVRQRLACREQELPTRTTSTHAPGGFPYAVCAAIPHKESPHLEDTRVALHRRPRISKAVRNPRRPRDDDTSGSPPWS